MALAIAALLGDPVLTGVSGRDPHLHADVSHVAPAQFFRATSLTRSHPRQQLGARSLAYSHFSIHNWFVGKALDLVRPGGLVCFITSTSFMDAYDSAVRAYVASQASLVSAIRLPSGAFSRLGSTDSASARVGQRVGSRQGRSWRRGRRCCRRIASGLKPLYSNPTAHSRWGFFCPTPSTSPVYAVDVVDPFEFRTAVL